MLGATSADLTSCPRCGTRPQQLTLRRFRRDLGEQSYRAFLAHHLRAYRRPELAGARRDAARGLPETVRAAAEDLCADARSSLDPRELGSTSAREVLDRVATSVGEVAEAHGVTVGDAEALDAFEYLTLSLVLALDDDPGLRRGVLEAERGWLSRYGKFLAVAAAGGLLARLADPAWASLVGWGLVGAGLLPPVARFLGERA